MDFRKDLNSASQYTQQIFILSRQIEKIYAKFQTQQWTMKGGVQGKRGGGAWPLGSEFWVVGRQKITVGFKGPPNEALGESTAWSVGSSRLRCECPESSRGSGEKASKGLGRRGEKGSESPRSSSLWLRYLLPAKAIPGYGPSEYFSQHIC